MKRLLSLLLCAVLALFCATTAQAAGVSITLTASEYALHYAFDAGAQDPFVILEYTTPAEKGWMMLYSEDGHFEGDVSLAYSGAGGKTSVALTSARTTGSIGKASTTLPKAADYQKPTGKSNAKVMDFVLTETPEGVQRRRDGLHAPLLAKQGTNRHPAGLPGRKRALRGRHHQ